MNAKQNDEPSITISLATIYKEVCDGNRQTAEALHRIEILALDLVNVKQIQDTLKNDIESLKKSRWPIPSVAVLLSFFSLLYVLLKDSFNKGP